MATAETPAKVTSEDSSEITFVDNFQGATTKLLERFCKYFKLEDFAKNYYPEIYKYDPEFLKHTYSQLLDQMKGSIQGDIESLCNEHKIYLKLQELDDLAKEASLSAKENAWRPSGNPIEDVRDHRWKYKLAHKKLLENLLNNLRSENEELEKKAMIRHEEIMELKEKIIQQDEQNKADFIALEKVDLNMLEMFEKELED